MRYYIETYGCAANEFDSLVISDFLEKEGWERSDLNGSDLIIINTCGVKKPTEDKILYRLKEINALNKKIVVAGCLTRIDPEALKAAGFNVAIDVRSLNRIGEAAESALKGAKNEFIQSDKNFDKVAFLAKKLTQTIGVIEVQEGCAYNCSYCATKISRGSVFSFPDSSILRSVSELVRKGAVEIWLTGQDVAAYRYEKKDLADLLMEIDTVDKDFYVRVGMSTPPFFKAIAEKLLRSYPKKAYRFFHIPVQSGSDMVLLDMKRGYRASLFEDLVRKVRSFFPDATIETDIIVGYPTETEEDFEETIELLNRTRPNVVNISKFWKRPNTEASKFKELDSKVVAERSKKAYELILQIMKEENQKWIGWEGEALVTEKSEKRTGWKARNMAYKQIIIESEGMLLGKKVFVKVHGSDPVNLYARPLYVIDEKEPITDDTSFSLSSKSVN
ncbi:MAG: tRNA (N(6)-L-threonylcarbamoyladenosine(37)-C(2))-methylthiotransferase [Nitrososphaeria archaeon]|nr:tRNA (N(6)-L-threonylcarbamoyladenosine(37)-C(2))-methylthiotransferase [Conexivisphaerales archaeon]